MLCEHEGGTISCSDRGGGHDSGDVVVVDGVDVTDGGVGVVLTIIHHAYTIRISQYA